MHFCYKSFINTSFFQFSQIQKRSSLIDRWSEENPAANAIVCRVLCQLNRYPISIIFVGDLFII